MYLFVNTSNHEHIFLALINKKGEILNKKKIKAEYQQSEKLLENINKIIPDVSKLKGIIAIIGPGGFTSLRIGIAAANTMAWALNIPIVGVNNKNNLDSLTLINKSVKLITSKKAFKKQILPKYGKEPNITIKKYLF
ncbi:hypothetical protein L6278_01160 [Candidatus Parcubacteria bacterium]|nr:hypothetical protein [Patescibacteria group bacterium]MCG2686728.1 hypothetical protein [Candidatus Parcubacteria bacterium]